MNEDDGEQRGLWEAPAAISPHSGHRERLRDRFMRGGDKALPDYEMLELVLFNAIPRRDTKPLAKELIARFGTFSEVVSAPETRLREIKGVSDRVITELKLVRAAALRLMQGQIMERKVLSSWDQVVAYCRAAMAYEVREQFRILFLDKKNNLIADEMQQQGTVDHTPVYVREVVKRDHSRAPPPVGRSDAVARGYRHDQDDHRCGQAVGRARARPHHRRPRSCGKLQGPAINVASYLRDDFDHAG